MIEISNALETNLRLCIGADLPKGMKYMNLSHCWGLGLPFKLLKNNITNMIYEILFNELSRTFRDAVIATQTLGVTFGLTHSLLSKALLAVKIGEEIQQRWDDVRE